LLLCFLLLVSLSTAVNERLARERLAFADFMVKFDKTYSDASEKLERFKVFQDNLKRIEKQNENSKHARFGVNKFSDMTPEEFQQTMLQPKISAKALATSCLLNGIESPQPNKLTSKALPTSWDWNAKGAVTPVKNQGMCGSCWTFSVTGCMEGQWFLKGNKLTSFSEQIIVDCSHGCCYMPGYGNVCNQGCNGGWQWNAYFDIVGWGGIETEAEYPYQGVTGSCQMNKKKLMAPLKNYTCLSTTKAAATDAQMMQYIYTKGPISIALDATLLMSYYGGIIDPFFPSWECDPTQLDHALLIVGWGQERNWIGEMTPYWYVKNSWGADWGDSGYFMIAQGYNLCGINEAVSAAIM